MFFQKFLKVKYPIFKLVFILLFVTISLLFYYFNFGCLILKIFKIHCIGCGLTSSYISLFNFDILGAFKHNFMFWSIPILLLFGWFDGKLTKNKYIDICILIIIIFGLILNWLLKFFI